MEAGEPMMNRAKVQAIGLTGLVDELSRTFDLSSDTHKRVELAKRSGIALEMKRALHELVDLLVKQGKLRPEAPTNGDTSHWVRYHSDDGFAFKLPYDGPLRDDGITVFGANELPLQEARASIQIGLDLINASRLGNNRDLGKLRATLQRVGRELLGARSVLCFADGREDPNATDLKPLDATLTDEARRHPEFLFYCPDTQRSRHLAQAARDVHARQVVATAVTDEAGHVLGHLEIHLPDSMPLAPSDLTLVRMLATTAGATLEDSRNLEEGSSKDPLTKLYNQQGYEDAIAVALARAERSKGSVALMICDIDHFKRVNDDYNYETGNTVLKAVGDALKKGVRPFDIVARWGGDEFAVVLTQDVTEENVLVITERLRASVEALSLVVDGGARTIKVTISAGVAMFPEHAESPKALWNCANDAHKLAKQEPKNQIYFYRPLGPIHAEEVRTRHTSAAPPRIHIVPPPPSPPGTSARSES